MGSTEIGASESEKGSKVAALQEQIPSSSSAAIYPDWPGFQTYSSIPQPGFFPSPMASTPQTQPYFWGGQQFMPPYAPSYVAMYPPGGLYPHPSFPVVSHPFSPYAMASPNGNAETTGAVVATMELDGKSEVRDQKLQKKSKGSLGSLDVLTGKSDNEVGKTSGESTNGLVSQSGESVSEGSYEGIDTDSQNESQKKKLCRQDFLEAEASQNESSVRDNHNGSTHHSPQAILNQVLPIMPMPANGAPLVVTAPATNLNIGMEYWGVPAAPMPMLRGNLPATPAGGPVIPTTHDGTREPDLWLQDERELKRQKRKQSNRESARRSRLRKQAECEELAQRVGSLKEENTALIDEVNQFREKYAQLVADNSNLKEKLDEISKEHAD